MERADSAGAGAKRTRRSPPRATVPMRLGLLAPGSPRGRPPEHRPHPDVRLHVVDRSSWSGPADLDRLTTRCRTLATGGVVPRPRLLVAEHGVRGQRPLERLVPLAVAPAATVGLAPRVGVVP